MLGMVQHYKRNPHNVSSSDTQTDRLVLPNDTSVSVCFSHNLRIWSSVSDMIFSTGTESVLTRFSMDIPDGVTFRLEIIQDIGQL